MLEATDIKTKQLVALLLSGLSVNEIARLQQEHINFATDTIDIIGEGPRTIPLNPALKSLFKQTSPCPAWNKNQNVSPEMLESILVYANVDDGFSGTQEVNAASITHTYIIYLVKQDLRLAELEQVIGYTAPTTLAKYSSYSPKKRGLPIAEINRVYPVLENTDPDSL